MSASSSPNSSHVRHSSKNFLFDFPDTVNHSEIEEMINKNFHDPQISIKKEENGKLIYYVTTSKNKNITALKKYTIKGKVPIIRTVRSDEKFQGLACPNSNLILASLEKFLSFPNDGDLSDLQTQFKKILTNINVVVHSEYILSSIVLNEVINLGVPLH